MAVAVLAVVVGWWWLGGGGAMGQVEATVLAGEGICSVGLHPGEGGGRRHGGTGEVVGNRHMVRALGPRLGHEKGKGDVAAVVLCGGEAVDPPLEHQRRQGLQDIPGKLKKGGRDIPGFGGGGAGWGRKGGGLNWPRRGVWTYQAAPPPCSLKRPANFHT